MNRANNHNGNPPKLTQCEFNGITYIFRGLYGGWHTNQHDFLNPENWSVCIPVKPKRNRKSLLFNGIPVYDGSKTKWWDFDDFAHPQKTQGRWLELDDNTINRRIREIYPEMFDESWRTKVDWPFQGGDIFTALGLALHAQHKQDHWEEELMKSIEVNRGYFQNWLREKCNAEFYQLEYNIVFSDLQFDIKTPSWKKSFDDIFIEHDRNKKTFAKLDFLNNIISSCYRRALNWSRLLKNKQ